MSVPTGHAPTIEDAAALDLPAGLVAEIIGGRIVVSPSEDVRNNLIASDLQDLLQQVLPRDRFVVLRGVNVGTRFEYVIPDLVVADRDAVLRLADAEELLVDWVDVALVVEVVSRDPRGADRDYGTKARLYPARGLPRYWILDPIRRTVTEVTGEGRTSSPSGLITDGYCLPVPLESLLAPSR